MTPVEEVHPMLDEQISLARRDTIAGATLGAVPQQWGSRTNSFRQ